MRLREVYLSDTEAMVIAATRIWNLDLHDPIAYLKIQIIGTANNEGGDCRIYLPKGISKIEVVDGSDVLYSASMPEALAMHLYSGGGMPYQLAWGTNDDHSVCMVELRFGRDNSDQEYMLDPKKFVNPQLKITYNLPETAGNWTVNTKSISVSAMVAENSLRDPVGFFMTKNIYSWEHNPGNMETIDMPRDFPYRLLLIRSHYAPYATWNYFDSYKMSCDIDRFVPFNVKTPYLARQNQEHYNPQFMLGGGRGDGTHVCHIPHHFSWVHGANFDKVPPAQADVSHGGIAGYYIDYHEDAAAAVNADTIISQGVWGAELFGAEPWRFGNLRDSEEWFDPTSYMSVRLLVDQNVAVPAPLMDDGIVLQQARPY